VAPAPIIAQINEGTVAFYREVKDGVAQFVAGNSYKWFYFIHHSVGNRLKS
jgi:hypothetical protein